ncbi:MAG: glutamate formimidoyltransferase [Acidobacteriaceae bacterium]|jgi:glutamate formiminotransferase|nr:glutamate formimidoyltransferase [Acidobacteriaceae bacterium]
MLIESVPNLSEGRRVEVVDACARDIAATPDVRLLNYSADASHNRSVFTLLGHAAALHEALGRVVERAIHRIDLREARGVHPRIGAVDVVPFVPIGETTMDECVALARTFAQDIAERFQLPVYLYERAALRPERRRLEDIRRGEFEGLAAKMTNAVWRPDYGPSVPHPTAGATVVGARPFLVAYNINLATDRIDLARAIATTIRERDGGLPAVKALGLAIDGGRRAQVSMNLTDITRTTMRDVFERVTMEAARLGIKIAESELIGLIPKAALGGATADDLRLHDFSPDRMIEHFI